MSNLVNCEESTKAIALLFGQKSLIFITFQSAININQCQIWSVLSKIPRLNKSHIFITFQSAIKINQWNYQRYSLTFLPKIAHFHHFSICNKSQSMSNLVIYEQNTKAIASLFGHKLLIFITFQSASKVNQCQIWSFLSKIPRL